MKSIYIVLTKTNTALSRAIGVLTAEAYTHASISMDSSLESLYTFSRLQPDRPLPAGFTTESPYNGYMGLHPDTACEVYELKIANSAYYRMQRKLNWMKTNADMYRYSLLGTLYCMFHIKHKRPKHYFCSQFIGELLKESGAAMLPKHESLMHPVDYRSMPECKLIYHGNIHGLATYYIRRMNTVNAPAPELSFRVMA